MDNKQRNEHRREHSDEPTHSRTASTSPPALLAERQETSPRVKRARAYRATTRRQRHADVGDEKGGNPCSGRASIVIGVLRVFRQRGIYIHDNPHVDASFSPTRSTKTKPPKLHVAILQNSQVQKKYDFESGGIVRDSIDGGRWRRMGEVSRLFVESAL